MVGAAWHEFFAEIGRWTDAGRIVEFWWRDDDAARPEQPLERLLDLAAHWSMPLALAVIPARADPALFTMLPDGIDVLQHGADHANRAAVGEKKTEYPEHESIEVAMARLADARQRLATLAGVRSLAVLAPPWNRISAHLLPRLGTCFAGLSRYGARAASVPGLRQVNTHVDIIAWKAGRGFIGTEVALAQAARHLAARREGRVDAVEPTGWLTHHACHDEQAWEFLATLFERLRAEPGVRWRSARELFARTAGGPATSQ